MPVTHSEDLVGCSAAQRGRPAPALPR